LFKTNIDILNARNIKKLKMETIKRSQDISSKKDTHRKIQILNSEFNSLSSSVYECDNGNDDDDKHSLNGRARAGTRRCE